MPTVAPDMSMNIPQIEVRRRIIKGVTSYWVSESDTMGVSDFSTTFTLSWDTDTQRYFGICLTGMEVEKKNILKILHQKFEFKKLWIITEVKWGLLKSSILMENQDINW